MAGTWTFARNAEGEIEAHDGTRVRALIIKRPKSAVQWYVHRVSANGDICGGEPFRTLTAAKRFCDSNPGVWGR
jgi:hypothetical protein